MELLLLYPVRPLLVLLLSVLHVTERRCWLHLCARPDGDVLVNLQRGKQNGWNREQYFSSSISITVGVTTTVCCTTSERLFVLFLLHGLQCVPIFSISFPINRKTDFWICAHKSTDALLPCCCIFFLFHIFSKWERGIGQTFGFSCRIETRSVAAARQFV